MFQGKHHCVITEPSTGSGGGGPRGASTALRVLHRLLGRLRPCGFIHPTPVSVTAEPDSASSHPVISEIAPLVEQLKEQHTSLTPLSRDLESQFLKIAANLEKIPETSDALTAACERMFHLSGSDKEESQVSRVITHLKGPIEYVERYHSSSNLFLSTLRAGIEQINRMLSGQKRLHNTMAPLRYLRTLYRVESAALPHEMQANFMGLTEDIERLQNQMAKILNEKFSALRTNKQTMESLVERLSSLVGAQGTVMHKKREHLNKAISALRVELEANKEKDLKLTQTTQRMSLEAGKLVFAIQAQDVISQKLSHIISALTNLTATYEAFAIQTDPEQQARSLQYISQAAKVESAQLDAVRSDLNRANEKLTRALDQIGCQTEELDQSRGVQDEMDQPGTSTPRMIEALLNTLNEVNAIVTTTVSSANDAYHSIRPIGGQASNVTDIMLELQVKIKLIALNAQIQTAHLAGGTGLEVLAMQTATIADETGQISSQIAVELDAFTQKLNQLVEDFEHIHTEGVQGQNQWSTSAEEHATGLKAYRDSTMAELKVITLHSEEMRSLIKNMRECIDLKSLADQRVEGPADTLRSMHQCLESHIQLMGSSSLPLANAVAYTRTYTMESEKQVHLDATNVESRSQSAEVSDTIGQARLEGTPQESGDIVLFDEGPGVVVATAENPAGAPGELPDNASSSIAERGNKPKEALPAPAPTNLGDNIELF